MSLDVYLSVKACSSCGRGEDEVFSANITRNLNKMAGAAGIYKHLWRPDEIEIETASQLIEPLTAGLAWLKANETEARTYDSPNGWGIYDDFMPWIERYLDACKKTPTATVTVSR